MSAFREVNEQVIHIMIGWLPKLSVLTGNVDEWIAKQSHRAF
ncbi:MAG: hypothetical protein ACSLEL_01830 [Candidatus Malihini olakiniferum]